MQGQSWPYLSFLIWLNINRGLCSLSHVLMHLVLHFPKKRSMNQPIHTHLPTHTHALPLPPYKTQKSSGICVTSFCSQTKSLKANRCFHVIITSYHSLLPLIRLYFLTQMLRSSIYQMHQKSGQGGGGMSEH